ncbi:MAG: hypothetical protein CSB49_07655 [Proteobacteria bacterium]|nr:MAG: hypothetical protein CSB49_07655 [Pseudomonadota bacterium]
MLFDRRLPALTLLMTALVLPVAACQDQEVITTTRNLLRPGPMAMACVGRAGDAGVQTGFPISRCPADTERHVKCDAGVCGALFGMVANTARGDVAFFRTRGGGEPLVDLDHATPGFGFVPVGLLPSDLASTKDGCRAVSVNAGSCDLSVIDVPGVIRLAAGELERPAGGLVSTIVPHTAAGPLGARPGRLTIVPGSVPQKADEQTCAAQPAYRAYVTFPACGLLAEIDLRDGTIIRALEITKDGFKPTDSPSCPQECRGQVATTAAEAGVGDGSTDAIDGASDLAVESGVELGLNTDVGADAGPDSGAGADMGAGADSGADSAGGDATAPDAGVDGASRDSAADGSGGDASVTVAPAGVLPTAMAITPSGDKLFIASAGATFITAVDIAADGAFQNARRIVLAGDRAQTRAISVSPPTSKVGQFIYAIAADRSVRVISLELERECETNVDLLALPGDVDISKARCFPVGDPDTPPRRVGSDEGPGLFFGTRLPLDVTFATVARDPKEQVTSDPAKLEATPLVGVFAFVATSDGNVFVIDVQDDSRLIGDGTTVKRTHLPHHVRNALQGSDDGDESSEVDTILNVGSGGAPVIVEKIGARVLAVNGSDERQAIYLRAKGQAVASRWSLSYEARLLTRSSGQLTIDGQTLALTDQGADFCQAGARGQQRSRGRELRPGDIVEFLGCSSDGDCGLGQFCARVVGQESALGLCFDQSREAELFGQCGVWLRGKREFLVRRAFRGKLVLDALPLEPQTIVKAVQPQVPQLGDDDPCDPRQNAAATGANPKCQAGYTCSNGELTEPPVAAGKCYKVDGCQQSSDCKDTFLCALADGGTRGPLDSTSVRLRQGECFRPGCRRDVDCASGRCVQPLDGSPKVCAAAPPPLERGGVCKLDADCTPPASGLGTACDDDADCDSRAECRAPSTGGQKRCESRRYVCSPLPGLVGRCVRPSPCFAELQRYDVRAGRSFVIGSRRRIIADPQSGECTTDETQSPLFQDRIPIGLPVYPTIVGPVCSNDPGPTADPNAPWTIPEPNPCVQRLDTYYVGFRARGSAEGEQELTWGPRAERDEEPATVWHYANPDIQLILGVGHLSKLPTAAVGESTVAPMPRRGLSYALAVKSGYAQLSAPGSGSIALPWELHPGPDGYLYIVDVGDRSDVNSATRGQVLRWRLKDLALDSFQVK